MDLISSFLTLKFESFEALFVCPEAINSKQMPMCQKAKNSDFFFLKFLLNNFGKSEKSALKIPKVRGGGQRFLEKNSYLSHIF